MLEIRTLELIFLLLLSGHVGTRKLRVSSSDSTWWACPGEVGRCVESLDNTTAIHLNLNRLGGRIKQVQACLNKCLAYPGALGCKIWWDRGNPSCEVYTAGSVVFGNKTANVYCWLFSECRGGLPMFLGNFRYNGKSQIKRDRYIHISHDPSAETFPGQLTEYTWRNSAGRTCTLYQTDIASRLRDSTNCTGYGALNFSLAGFQGTEGEFYERVGLEFVGTWSVAYPKLSSDKILTYRFSRSGTVRAYKRKYTKKYPQAVSASNEQVFPPSQGWFKIENSHNIGIVEYIRVKDDLTLEARSFRTESHIVKDEHYCTGSYKSLPRYCSLGKGEKYSWILQEKNVCFETKFDKFGSFRMKYSGSLVAVKLVHTSGYVTCNRTRRNHKSFWGCEKSSRISIAITDEDNKIIFPRGWLDKKGWTLHHEYNSMSKELILNNPQGPEVSRGTKLRLWYGEDLTNWSEDDNDGRSCADVYSKITGHLGTLAMKLTFTIDVYNTSDIRSKILYDVKNYFHRTLSNTLLSRYFNITTLLRFSISKLKKSNDDFAEVILKIFDSISSFGKFSSSSISSRDAKFLFCQALTEAAQTIKLSSFSLIGLPRIRSYGCCIEDVYGDDSYKGRYIFTITPTDETMTLPCKYNTSLSLTRECSYNDQYGGSPEWKKPNLNQCPQKSKTTTDLDKLNATSRKGTKHNRLEIAQALNKIIPNASVIATHADLTFISDITSVIVRDVDETQAVNVTENVLETFSTLLDTAPSLVAEAEKSDTTATSLLNSMQAFSESIGRSIPSVGSNVTVSKKNVGIQVAKVTKHDVKVYSRLKTSGVVSVGIDDLNLQQTSDFQASVYIPSSAFDFNEGIVYSQAYLKSTLFVDKKLITNAENGTSTTNLVQSLVLSISVGKNVSQLEQPVILQFKKRSSINYSSTCSFWVFRDGDVAGTWNSSGCMFLKESTDGIVTCQCNHLTNFAILMDVYQTGSNPLSLQIITWIGCIISLTGLFLTIVIFSYFRNLRVKVSSKILLSLCISLTIFILVFIGGIEKSKHRISCQVIAGILHYFMMTSFTWMCVTAVNLFQLLVLVFRRSDEEKFFLRASILAWGMPLAIVVITAVVQPQQLGNERFCFPQGNAAHFGVLLPISIILAINFFVLFSIILKFARNKPVGDTQRENFNQARIALSISVLLGLTWILAIFAVEDAEFIFQLLFCIFNSLQGFFIFILYTLTNKAVHHEIKGFLRAHCGCYSVSDEDTNTMSMSVPLETHKDRRNNDVLPVTPPTTTSTTDDTTPLTTPIIGRDLLEQKKATYLRNAAKTW